MRIPRPFPTSAARIDMWLCKPPHKSYISHPYSCSEGGIVQVFLDGSEDVGLADFSFATNKEVHIHNDERTSARASRLARALIRDYAKAPARVFLEVGENHAFYRKDDDTWYCTDGIDRKHPRYQ